MDITVYDKLKPPRNGAVLRRAATGLTTEQNKKILKFYKKSCTMLLTA